MDSPDDSDLDGVCESSDVCPGGDDGIDTDGDGVADHCDLCPVDSPDDADGDGVCDSDPIPLPSGLIVAFSGSEVPAGWKLCDGSDGTPDMRERFVLGAMDDAVGDVGGGAVHSHEGFTEVTVMSTGHTSPGTRSCSPPGCWCTQKVSSVPHSHDMTHDHTMESGSRLPPYTDVLYLMQDDADLLPERALLAFSDVSSFGDVADDSWSFREDLDGRFLRGASGTTAGGTGGSVEHSHGDYTGMESATGAFYGSYGMTVTAHGPSATDMNHTHGYEHDHILTVESHLPPYYTISWAETVDDVTLPRVGSIAMWSGVADEIPRGWVLCDGTEGTPDLSGLFLLGTSSPSAIGDEGGETEHVHAMEFDSGGSTSMSGGGNGQCTGGGSLMAFHDHSVPGHDHGLSSDANEPPYVTLAYIMYKG